MQSLLSAVGGLTCIHCNLVKKKKQSRLVLDGIGVARIRMAIHVCSIAQDLVKARLSESKQMEKNKPITMLMVHNYVVTGLALPLLLLILTM